MFHTFDAEVAELFHDTNIATIFQNLCFWIIHNKTNEKNMKIIDINGKNEERYFTFNSIQAFLKQFPYFSKKQIESYLSKLKEKGLIAKASYNKLGFDRTSWYCLVDEDYWMCKYIGKKDTAKSQGSSQDTEIPNDDEINNPELVSQEEFSQNAVESSLNTLKISNSSISPKGEIEFPKRGNAFLQNGKSSSPKGEMHFSKTGNPFPQNGKPIPDINTDFKPNLKPNFKQNTAAAVHTTLQEIDPTLILDSTFYPAAAEFLNTFHLDEKYLRWFYQLLRDSKQITNIHGYFFKVFFREVYVERYTAVLTEQERRKSKNKPSGIPYACPVCGLKTEILEMASCCQNCKTPINPTDKDIERYAIIYTMDETTKEKYLFDRSKILRTGGNVSVNLVELDRQYGIVS